MKTKLALLILGVSSAMASTAFAGDIKPLHASITNKAIDITSAGQYCDVYVLNSNGVRTYTSAAVLDKGATIQKPKLGIKVGKWIGDPPTATGPLPANGDCVQGTGGQTHNWHLPNGAVAYDEGAVNYTTGHGGLNTAYPHATFAQWPAAGALAADNNTRSSLYSNMNYSPYYCVQVCKYPSNQHTGGAATTVTTGPENYDVYSHSHNAADAGHNPLNHSASTLVRQLCDDKLHPAGCIYLY
jgi:hypothetical protein